MHTNHCDISSELSRGFVHTPSGELTRRKTLTDLQCIFLNVAQYQIQKPIDDRTSVNSVFH